MIPNPKDLAKLLSSIQSIDLIDKQLLLLKIKHLSDKQISTIYQALLKIQKAESNFVNTINKVDLKYELKFQEAYADSVELKPKH